MSRRAVDVVLVQAECHGEWRYRAISNESQHLRVVRLSLRLLKKDEFVVVSLALSEGTLSYCNDEIITGESREIEA